MCACAEEEHTHMCRWVNFRTRITVAAQEKQQQKKQAHWTDISRWTHKYCLWWYVAVCVLLAYFRIKKKLPEIVMRVLQHHHHNIYIMRVHTKLKLHCKFAAATVVDLSCVHDFNHERTIFNKIVQRPLMPPPPLIKRINLMS